MNRIVQDPAYRELKNHLIELTGLAYYEGRDDLVTDLIGSRLKRLALANCSEYARFLAAGDMGSDETEFVISQLTIGETCFFRDEEQFAALRDVVLPRIVKRKQATKKLRIWSAGCATGAEAYSLAILLTRELGGRAADWQVDIYATDLNRNYLALAEEGKFREWALRSTSDEMKHSCFSKEGRVWRIHARYKQWISFHQMNLVHSEVSTPFVRGVHFDLILCRNVMIYFTAQKSRLLVDRFYEALAEEGWLVVGASECNQENYKAFRTVDSGGARFYQKKSLRPLPELVPDPLPPAAPGPADSSSFHPPAEARSEAGVNDNARVNAEACSEDLEGLRLLADRGDWKDAAAYGKRLLTRDQLNPAIHFYQALIAENLGVLDEPERSLRRAIYLDRNFALAHYHLGLALKRHQQIPEAARSFSNVLKVLAGMPGEAIVGAGPGVTVTGLKDLARMHLENV